jgi:predicted nucleotidyltransferase
MTPEEIIRALRAGAAALAQDYGVSAMWIFGPAARLGAGPVVEVDLLLELLRPADIANFIALRRRLETLLGGVRVEPVLRPAALPEGVEEVLADATRVF